MNTTLDRMVGRAADTRNLAPGDWEWAWAQAARDEQGDSARWRAEQRLARLIEDDTLDLY